MNLAIPRHTQNINVLTSFKHGKFDPSLLKSYTGWGGLREAIYTPSIYRELRQLLSPDEIVSLKKTLKNAYYTPKEIVNCIYQFLNLEGFNGGDILEPAVGNGVFIEHMPDTIKQNSTITAIEIDKITATICKQLYPKIALHNCGFEEFQPNQQYDLIIGNPPYGSQMVNDASHPDLNAHCIHHYFVAKSMRLLKQGGILAMVLPSYFMDNQSKHVRNIIDAEDGELIAAYRLPEDLFQNAKITVDLVFIRKGKTANTPAWLKTPRIKIDGYPLLLNEYYHQNPTHILGKLAAVDMFHRKGLTCLKSDTDPFSLFHQQVKHQQEVMRQKTISELKIKAEVLNQRLEKITGALTATSQGLSEIISKLVTLEKLETIQ